MTIKCGSCGSIMHKIDNNGKQYFLCTIDTNSKPVNVDIGTGMPVDAYGCVSCGSVTLTSNALIGQKPKY